MTLRNRRNGRTDVQRTRTWAENIQRIVDRDGHTSTCITRQMTDDERAGIERRRNAPGPLEVMWATPVKLTRKDDQS